ncbi:MAG: AAA family ATPase [Nanoarchaeota archaeon]|nr:AAA family ATPase [Nanoarchaeota archaeon]
MDTNNVFSDIYETLKSKGKRKMIIGITGFVGSGKTFFAKEFVQFLKEKKINSLHFRMDIYNSSTRSDRNAVIASLKDKYDPNWPRRAYPQNTNLIKNHLTNIKQERSFSAPNLCDPATKKLDFPIEFLFSKEITTIKLGKEENKYDKNNLWILCDGVKLIEYKDYLDCIIFLRAEYETRFNRLLERNKSLPSPANIRKDLFDDLENNLILDHDLKEEHANIIVDNDNYNDKKIVKL